jgi:phosphate starvation-inducible protein PhoH
MALQPRKRKVSNQPRQFRNVFDSINLIMNTIKPLTDNQSTAFKGFENGSCMLLLGSAGSGKSYQAIYHALKDIEQGKARKLIIIRSAVPTRDQGFLKGSLEEKEQAYTIPYQGIINELFGRGDAWALLVKHNIIEFMSTSYIRGITLDNCVIVFDEIQNANFGELSTIMTRVGKNTLVHFCGDFHQSDLKQKDRALHLFTVILDRMPECRTVEFTINDCVRSGLARSFLINQYAIYGNEVIN